jgi:hypothetical protein
MAEVEGGGPVEDGPRGFGVDIGLPQRVIEIEPASLPVPEPAPILEPSVDPLPEPGPAPVPEPAPEGVPDTSPARTTTTTVRR